MNRRDFFKLAAATPPAVVGVGKMEPVGFHARNAYSDHVIAHLRAYQKQLEYEHRKFSCALVESVKRII